MAVGKGSMARASRAAAKEPVAVTEEKTVKQETAAEKKTTVKRTASKRGTVKKTAAKKSSGTGAAIGIGQEMPVYYY